MTRIYLLAAKRLLINGYKPEALRMLKEALAWANRDGSERSNILRALNYARRV